MSEYCVNCESQARKLEAAEARLVHYDECVRSHRRCNEAREAAEAELSRLCPLCKVEAALAQGEDKESI